MPRRPDPLPRGAMPLRERHTLAEQWDEFAEAVGLNRSNVSTLQRREMRRAFYGGAIAFFGLLSHDVDGGVETTELDLEYIGTLYAELEAYQRDLERGRA